MGEYSQNGILTSVLTVLNRSGTSDILDVPLKDAEQAKFQHSVDVIRKYMAKISKYAE